MKEIIYRKAEMEDILTLIDFRIIFLKEIQKNIAKEKEKALRSELKKYFTKSLNHSCVSWLAEYNKNPVGLGTMVIREQPGHFNLIPGRTGYILNMFTLPDFRGKGICSEILKQLIEFGKSLKIQKFELHATKMGGPIYRNFGFKEPDDKVMELIVK
jgi:GNAT superfamily N-acetyltransferase